MRVRVLKNSPPFDFAQGRLFGDDNQKGQTAEAKTTAKATADPYGMTTKKAKANGNSNGISGGRLRWRLVGLV
jgi:hypothetical protein